jgi:hypothetical protein
VIQVATFRPDALIGARQDGEGVGGGLLGLCRDPWELRGKFVRDVRRVAAGGAIPSAEVNSVIGALENIDVVHPRTA